MTYWQNRRTLVTGGCGFIGSYLVEELVAAGAQVTVVDNLATGRLENLSAVRDSIDFIEGDLHDFDTCLRAARTSDTVLNLAGLAFGLEYSMKHHGEMLYHNAIIQLQMLEAARCAGIERFLVTSSSCVYPDDAPIPTPELEVTDQLPEDVNRGYGWAKRLAELQAGYYQKEYDLEIAICRPFNPYGGRYIWAGEKSHVIPTLVKKVMDGNDPMVVWGSGRQRRNFLHVRDAARLMMLITQNVTDATPVNIGYDEDVSIADLVGIILEVSGRSPAVEFDTTKPEGRFRKCPDATRLRSVTDGYSPTITLHEGIQEMIDWYHRTFPECG